MIGPRRAQQPHPPAGGSSLAETVAISSRVRDLRLPHPRPDGPSPTPVWWVAPSL